MIWKVAQGVPPHNKVRTSLSKTLKLKQVNSRKKKRYQWPFTKKMANGSSKTPSLPTPESPGQSSGKWYQSIIDLPLSRYISAKVDGNLQALVIEGNPTPNDLEKAWLNIEMECIDLVGTVEQKAELKLKKDIDIMQANLLICEVCIQQLSLSYHPDFEMYLNNILKANIKLDPTDPVKYHALLKNCWNRSRGIKINLDLKVIEYNAVAEKLQKQGEGQPYTREYFATMLITLSDFAQYQVQDTITVFEYYDRLRRLIAHNAEMDRRNKKAK